MLRRNRALIVACLAPWLAVALSGCATPPAPGGGVVERISFRPSPPPFCGRCETTAFTVGADGEVRIEKGYWAGSYRDWRIRRTVKHVTAEQFAAFKRRLAAYKPAGDVLEGERGCQSYLSDNDGVVVEWSGDGEARRRVFDFGCLDDRAMNETVRGAPSVLGL